MTRIYLLAPIPFSYLHQRPQSLAEHFVQAGYPVTYVEPCGFSDFLSGRKKGVVRIVFTSVAYWVLALCSIAIPLLRRPPAHKRTGRPDRHGLELISLPLLLPYARRDLHVLERFNALVYRQALNRKVLPLRSTGEQDVALVEHPFWGAILQREDFSRICYDCLDEIGMFSGMASQERFLRYEASLVEKASAIFVTARELEEELDGRYPAVPIHRVPNGVNCEWFREKAKQNPRPADLAPISKPIVGYVGTIAEWMDFALIEELARRLDAVSFVMVGPALEDRIRPLKGRRNIFWLGRKDYEEVPAYIDACDVCIIPFRTGGLTRTTNPVKIFEYFACGKPVVTTRLDELVQYRDGKLLYMADGIQEFVVSVERALRERDRRRKQQRIAVARRNSWASRAASMIRVMETKKGAGRA